MATVKLRILGECVIEVGERRIGPEAPQLFALLLYLGMANGRAVHKTELFELLFPGARDGGRASHNLRQLLYRLRGMGVEIETAGDRVQIPENAVHSSLSDFVILGQEERVLLHTSRLAVLPSYEPDISAQFADWLETVRSQCTATLRGIIRDDFRQFKGDCNWESLVSSGEILTALDASSEEIVSGMAEALLLLGRKHDALDRIDAFITESSPTDSLELRRLRARISRASAITTPVESSFYGRSDVMRELARQWDDATALLPQLAVIIGSAGIGKTRLAAEFCSLSNLRGAQQLIYRCDTSDVARPHSLFRSLLPQLRSMRGSLGASPELKHHLDRISSEATPASTLERAASEAVRVEIQLALMDLVEAVATEAPILLMVDDAHLLDTPSRAVLKALIDTRNEVALMVICCYRSCDAALTTPRDRKRFQIHRLSPLSDSASLLVLTDLLPSRRDDEGFLRTCIAQAGGNPYYLHAIAYRSRSGEDATRAPFDVAGFASSVYFGLHSDARTLYEACLLLGRFATLQRVRDIAGIDGAPLLTALRELESSGLIDFADGELRCAHALLEEASLPLIPRAVAAALRARIAEALERDCVSQQYPATLAWAAAQNWLAAGAVDAAARLLMHCASQAAALGEPRTAAQALRHIPLDLMTLREQAVILRLIVDYSEIAGDRDQLSATLRQLYQITRDMGSNSATIRDISFRIIEVDLRHDADPSSAIPLLTAFLNDLDASDVLRLRAGIRLLVAADMCLDEHLATCTLALLIPLLTRAEPSDALKLQAELIYHTVFGDQSQAATIAASVLRQYPRPDLSQAAIGSRRNAGNALSRMGFYDLAQPLLSADYDFMRDHHVTTEALYKVMLLAEACLRKGHLADAHAWLREGNMLLSMEPQARALEPGLYSTAASLAIIEGKLREAEELINDASLHYPAIGSPRFAAIALSLRLKVQLAQGNRSWDRVALEQLKMLYQRGGHLGAQDMIVETLWLAETHDSNPRSASELLYDYVVVRRREKGAVDWTLRTTTASDSAWNTIAMEAERTRKGHTA